MSKAAPAKVAAAPSPAVHAREKNIDLALSAITKQFGEGSIMRLGSNAKMKVETLSTGSLAIDLALGVGGLPKGRIVEVYGPESSGKTTFCLSVIAEAHDRAFAELLGDRGQREVDVFFPRGMRGSRNGGGGFRGGSGFGHVRARLTLWLLVEKGPPGWGAAGEHLKPRRAGRQARLGGKFSRRAGGSHHAPAFLP